MKFALPRTPLLAVTIAALGLFAVPSANAGTKEINAITAKLPAGITIASATAQQLSDAVIAALNDPVNKLLSTTVIGGEALKGTTDSTFGTVFGQAIFASTTNTIPRIADKNKFVAGASVSASTGKTANATQIPTFSAEFITNNADAVTLALLAKSSTTAIGAIFGGRALEVTTEFDRLAAANAGIQNTTLKKAAQQIAQYVGDTVPDDTSAASFAGALAGANTPFFQKIAVGVTASNPNAANEITTTLLGQGGTTGPLVKAAAPKYAKAVGLVGSVEQVTLLADTLGKVVASNQVASTGKALIQAISGRTGALALGTGENSLVNKADEIGEITAYYINAIVNNPLLSGKFLGTTTPKSATAGVNTLFNLIKTMYKGAVVKTIKSNGVVVQKSTALQEQLLLSPGNFAASISFTLSQLTGKIDQTILSALQMKLTTPSSVASIGGKTNAATLASQFGLGYAGNGVDVPNGKTGFEDGTGTSPGSDLGSIVDAETDTRNS